MRAPLLLIPGTLCDERVFGPMLARLDGAAGTPPIAHADVAEAADALLASAPPRFVAGGFSLGGFVVLEMLRRAPERLAGAVLIAGNVEPLAEGLAEARRAEVETAKVHGAGAVIEALWPRCVARRNLADLGIKERLVAMAEAVGPDLFERQAELAITRPDSRATLLGAPVPILLLCGEEDAMSPPERCGGVLGPTTTRHMLPGVGHFIPLEAPSEAAGAVDAWMREALPCC